MPTYEVLPRFTADLDRLTPDQRRRFRRTVAAFVEDLRTGSFRAGLRETDRFPDSWRALATNLRVIVPERPLPSVAFHILGTRLAVSVDL